MDKVQILMENLGITREQALDVIKSDIEIDKGGDPFPLDNSQKKVVSQMTRGERTKTPTKTKRERKPNAEKIALINAMVNSVLENGGDKVELLNTEREFEFFVGETKYKVVLSNPRT